MRKAGLPLGAALASVAVISGPTRAGDVVSPTPETAREWQSLRTVCGHCHDLQIVLDTPRSLNDWRDTIQKMVDLGASGTDAQYDDILAYLHRTMTTIDVNSADADELATVLDAPDAAVKLIVARRARKKFVDLDDLKTISGLDVAILDMKKRLIYFQ